MVWSPVFGSVLHGRERRGAAGFRAGLLRLCHAAGLGLPHGRQRLCLVPDGLDRGVGAAHSVRVREARDAGASDLQTLTAIIIPLARPGILIGSIFVLTVVLGDFLTIGIMGGQQVASVGKVIQTQMQFLQFPLAAANAVILLVAVLAGVWALLKLVDIRKEL
ncbi:MAG: ABC transporter permease subunit [Roseicyclus sp.]